MKTPARILVFIGLALLGYASIFGIIMLRLQLTGTLPDDAHLASFTTLYLGGGPIACIIGTGLGVISFFTLGRVSQFFLLLPVAVPAIYCAVTMLYFTF